MKYVAACLGFFLSKIRYFADRYNKNAINPEITGEVIQLEAIFPTVPQETYEAPFDIKTKPTIAPTIE